MALIEHHTALSRTTEEIITIESLYMQVSVEISLYPLTPEYDPPIIDFINRLHDAHQLKVFTNQLSTQLVGPYDAVMSVLTEAMRPTLAMETRASFVIKILNVTIEPGAPADI